ncbi:DUF169 domain-containing protein [Acidaminobacter sp. JC074]|uniref:DUF169 domain-containing protein n=1 Tax=Acidaminobacter sp. JC074 TaxID=2530199 RepID=UPI001F0DD7EB|nr:DUF169 domain-containing protein [Acidaminobacter sp. JC074]
MFSLLKDVLKLDREIVGVTLCMNKEDYLVSGVKELKEKMSYCNMVKYGTKGKAFKARLDHFFCGGSQRALGMRPLEDNVMTGEEYYSYKMYESLQVAKSVQEEVTYLPNGTYGVIVEPLKDARKPDIVIMILNPYQAMRLTQAYAFSNGVAKNIKFTGNQGICSECTAVPYINQDMNVSLLCANTRFSAKWQDHEMAVGLPYQMFEDLVTGLVKTLNASEPDKRKVEMMDLKDKYGLDISLKTSYYKSSKR